MFFISLPPEAVAALNANVAVGVKINGQDTLLTKEGEYLCWEDQRRKILGVEENPQLTTFYCASADGTGMLVSPGEVGLPDNGPPIPYSLRFALDDHTQGGAA